MRPVCKVSKMFLTVDTDGTEPQRTRMMPTSGPQKQVWSASKPTFISRSMVNYP
jgi:hypothetical protein